MTHDPLSDDKDGFAIDLGTLDNVAFYGRTFSEYILFFWHR